jgi:hypothetical protein
MKKYNMQDFIDKKVAVTFANESEKQTMLQECEKQGMRFQSGELPTHMKFNYPTEDLSLVYDFEWQRGLGYGNHRGAAVKFGWQFVPFSSFTFAQTAPSYTPPLWAGIVTAETTSQEVNAMLDQLRKVRFAKQQAEQPKPAEKPSAPAPWKPKAGEMVYLDKDMNGLTAGTIVNVEGICNVCGEPYTLNAGGRKLHLWAKYLRPVRKEDRPAKVGEWVKTINPSAHNIPGGTILKCEKGKGEPISFGGDRYISPHNYRVLVPYDPTNPTEAAHA